MEAGEAEKGAAAASPEEDYFSDADAPEDESPEEGGSPAAAAGLEAAAPGPTLRNWLSGRRGWLLIVALTLAQAVFATIVIALRSRSRPLATARTETLSALAADMLGREVKIGQIYQVMPVQGGRKLTVYLDMALILGELPEERVEGAERPNPEEMELFLAAVSEMEPNIRSRAISLIRRIPPERYATGEAHKEIAEDVKAYVNDLLAGLNFGARLRPGLSKRRITEVLLPAFIRQQS